MFQILHSRSLGEPDGAAFPVHWPLWLLRLLLLLSATLSGYLAYNRLWAEASLGCGLGGLCSEVLASRWAMWLGVPVSLPALSLFATALVSTFFITPQVPLKVRSQAEIILISSLVTAAIAGAWFTLIQVLEPRLFCIYCLTIHLSALSALTFSLLQNKLLLSGIREKTSLFASSLLTMAILTIFIVGQLFTASSANWEIEHVNNEFEISPFVFQTPTDPETITKDSTNIAPDKMLSDLVHFNRRSFPLLGSPDATICIATLYDYTCHSCRQMHFQIQQAVQHFDREIAVILVPVPLHSSCNASVQDDGPRHRDACNLTRLAIAVWRLDTEAFIVFDRWLFESERPRTWAAAKKVAARLVGTEDLEEELNHWFVNAQIEQNTSLYAYLGADTLPKLVLPKAILSGTTTSDRELIQLLRQHLHPAVP